MAVSLTPTLMICITMKTTLAWMKVHSCVHSASLTTVSNNFLPNVVISILLLCTLRFIYHSDWINFIIPLLAVHLNFCLCFRHFIKHGVIDTVQISSRLSWNLKGGHFQISMTLSKPFEISVYVISKESLNFIETHSLGESVVYNRL